MANSTHDRLTTVAGDFILSQIRAGDATWSQVFSSTSSRVGDWSWPRPDYVIKDYDNNITCAYEFKPPNQNKREYLTGLGQSIAYLQKHHYSGLIVPTIADDGFEIAEYIKTTLLSDEFKHLPINLISYDPKTLEIKTSTSMNLLKKISSIRTTPLVATITTNETYWAFWRDISHYEIFVLLELSDKYRDKSGDIYTDHIYPYFFKYYLNAGRAKDWEGRFRSKTFTAATKRAEKQNYKIPLFHLNLWSQSEGRLTYKGHQLLILGKMFGVDSQEYLDYLAYLLLTEGRHLELINEISEYQHLNYKHISKKSAQYKKDLDLFLEKKGSIGKRKPSAITTGAKSSYIRDEFKVWNKLGLLNKKSATSYFYAKEGLKFNLNKITSVLMKDHTIE